VRTTICRGRERPTGWKEWEANGHYIVKSECAIYRAQIHLCVQYIVADICSGVYVRRVRPTGWKEWEASHYVVRIS